MSSGPGTRHVEENVCCQSNTEQVVCVCVCVCVCVGVCRCVMASPLQQRSASSYMIENML